MSNKITLFTMLTKADRPMKKSTSLSIRLLPVLALLACLFLSATATASDWERLDSIHFNAGELDFGTVPRRGIVWYEPTDRPIITGSGINSENERAVYEISVEKDRIWSAQRDKLNDRLLKVAFNKERAGQWKAARQEYEDLAARLGWTGSARDRVEVLTRFVALSKRDQNLLLSSLRRYLHAMALQEAGHTQDANRAFLELSTTPQAGYIREHALYQTACAVYDQKQYAAAIPIYQRLLSLYPHSIKAEAAFIMLARASILPAQTAGDAQIGMNAVQQLLHTFPHSRFRAKAIGLAGRYHLLAGHMHQAAWCYLQVGDLESMEIVRKRMWDKEAGLIRVALFVGNLRRLEATQTQHHFEHALYALNRLTKILTSLDSSRIAGRIVHDPQVGGAYLYYRIYHCTNKPEDLLSLAHLADKIIARTGGRRLAPLVRVRLAEVFYQAKAYRKALVWSERAADPIATDRTLFVQGATLHKLARNRTAIARFEALLKRYPDSSLRHGAREELALLYEATGDLSLALKQYFLLGYQTDVAFLLDARMSIAQIENYYQRSVDSRDRIWGIDSEGYYDLNSGKKATGYTERELVAYSLGIRYLRKEKWEAAQMWMHRVPRATYIAFSEGRSQWETKASPDPLQAIRELGRLQRAIVSTPPGAARAAAMYRYATYYYTHGSLLLYNSAAWLGERRSSFDEMWNKTHFTEADEVATRTHMYEHEVYARTMALCKEIARRYPHTPSAPKALYRAACCANYLSGYNEWWRTGHNWHGQGKRQDQLSAEAVRLLNLLVRRYPKDPLIPSARKYVRVFAGGS